MKELMKLLGIEFKNELTAWNACYQFLYKGKIRFRSEEHILRVFSEKLERDFQCFDELLFLLAEAFAIKEKSFTVSMFAEEILERNRYL